MTRRLVNATVLMVSLVLAVLASIWFLSMEEDTPTGRATAVETGADVLSLPIISTTALETLDPIRSVEAIQYSIDAQIFEGLVTIDERGDVVSALAESWEASPDLKTWRFKLRDARFPDDPVFEDGRGRAVVAEDVVYSLTRGLNPAAGSKGAWALSGYVVGAADFVSGKAASVSGLRSLDDRTIVIQLVSGNPYFLPRLAFASAFVVPREAVEKYGPEFGLRPVGTGPYRVDHWEADVRLVLRRNEAYGIGEGWQPEPGRVERIEFVFFRSDAQVIAAFERGELDVRDVFGADLAEIKGEDATSELSQRLPKARVVRPGDICKVHLFAPAIGEGRVFGQDPRIRIALSQLFPRDWLDQNVLKGTGIALNNILPPMIVEQMGEPRTLNDPTALLRKALTGKTVKVAFVSSRVNDIVIARLEGVLVDAGAEVVRFPSTSVNALFANQATVRPDLTLIYWQPVFPSVPEYMTALLSSARPVPNFTGFADPEIDGLVQDLKGVLPNDEAYSRIVDELQRELAKELPWIPLYYERPLIVTSNRVENYIQNILGVPMLSKAEIKQK